MSRQLNLQLAGHSAGATRSGARPAQWQAGEAGAGSVLMLAIAAAAIVMTVLAGMLGKAVIARHRAQAAADLAALAAAGPAGGCAIAARVVAANGGCLESCAVQAGGSASVIAGVPCSATGSAGGAPGVPAIGPGGLEMRVHAHARAGPVVPSH